MAQRDGVVQGCRLVLQKKGKMEISLTLSASVACSKQGVTMELFAVIFAFISTNEVMHSMSPASAALSNGIIPSLF